MNKQIKSKIYINEKGELSKKVGTSFFEINSITKSMRNGSINFSFSMNKKQR
jgi:hypothetical protein